ncbi:Outer dense fiber protein 3 [Frankliniella fusca]|uniref:Outer dense fiber protein 3 n=1 Tax=Frankliniella fusca TaxID=407009 RepID=A0AAE1LLK0_9NEOP|nr:Outer dense fiber protein 3 [Frankliniella fusca]
MSHSGKSRSETRRHGPGPCAYLLPSTVGYHGHDSTRERRPAYSMGQARPQQLGQEGPGPDCMLDKYTRFGRTDGPSYSMAPRLAPLSTSKTPGPGQYSPEKWLERDKASAFSLLQRLPTRVAFPTPAPNAYTLPSCLQGTVRHLGQRLDQINQDCSPGPAHYRATQLDVSRWRMPRYSMATRTPLPGDRSLKPAPNAYKPTYNKHRKAPEFSFGVRHTDCEFVPLTDEDKYPPALPPPGYPVEP